MKDQTAFRLSRESNVLLNAIAEADETTKTAAIELAIKKLAQEKNIRYEKRLSKSEEDILNGINMVKIKIDGSKLINNRTKEERFKIYMQKGSGRYAIGKTDDESFKVFSDKKGQLLIFDDVNLARKERSKIIKNEGLSGDAEIFHIVDSVCLQMAALR